ncbi:MAG: hypothetical protein KAW12_01040 [Candidatus Aminicenantes bacterium]|nr:hypothetical protein [Candidatus Aminicenantes bacterium]
MNHEKARTALLALFFKFANNAMGPDGLDIARSIVNKMFKKGRSTKDLTIDELRKVVTYLANRTDTPLDLSWMGKSKSGSAPRGKAAQTTGYKPGSPIKPASEKQWKLIGDIAVRLGMSAEKLQEFVGKFHMNAQGKLTIRGGQGVIQALKSMAARRIQEPQAPAPQPKKKKEAAPAMAVESLSPLDKYPDVPTLGAKYRKVKATEPYAESRLLAGMEVNRDYRWAWASAPVLYIPTKISYSDH